MTTIDHAGPRAVSRPGTLSDERVASRALQVARRTALGVLGDAEAAADILHLARGLIDGALERGAVENLEQRLTWAILGYLALSRSATSA